VLPLQAAVAQRSASGRELARPSEDDIDGGKNCRESPARDCKRASVQGVALNDENWSAKPRPRANGLTEVRPPNFSLSDHHSELWRTLRAAR